MAAQWGWGSRDSLNATCSSQNQPLSTLCAVAEWVVKTSFIVHYKVIVVRSFLSTSEGDWGVGLYGCCVSLCGRARVKLSWTLNVATDYLCFTLFWWIFFVVPFSRLFMMFQLITVCHVAQMHLCSSPEEEKPLFDLGPSQKREIIALHYA